MHGIANIFIIFCFSTGGIGPAERNRPPFQEISFPTGANTASLRGVEENYPFVEAAKIRLLGMGSGRLLASLRHGRNACVGDFLFAFASLRVIFRKYFLEVETL
jgi:hypothetical protein